MKQKPRKPSADYPLFPHANGQWAKKIRGRLRYFGTWEQPQEALRKYLQEKDYYLAGMVPPAMECTVGAMVYQFLSAKRDLANSGELAQRTFQDYIRACKVLVKEVGEHTPTESLTPEHFRRLRERIARGTGPQTVLSMVNRIRVVFKFAYDERLISRPAHYGQSFNRPRAKTLRMERARQQRERGPRSFTADELRLLMESASPQMKAMIMVAINTGMGQRDIAMLPKAAKVGRWLDYHRTKTGSYRRAPLWDRTIAAIDAFVRPNSDEHDDLVFLTRDGNPWVRMNDNGTWVDSLGLGFGRLLRRCGLKRPGVNWYAIRHTFETVAGHDQPAIDCIMGHTDASVQASYREYVPDDRLIAVTDTVSRWLWNNS